MARPNTQAVRVTLENPLEIRVKRGSGRAKRPSAGEQKIAVMKIVKEVLGLGLKEAKDLVDAAPSKLKDGMKKAEAEEVKKKIEEVGGKVELK